jgi:hypothetical protein
MKVRVLGDIYFSPSNGAKKNDRILVFRSGQVVEARKVKDGMLCESQIEPYVGSGFRLFPSEYEEV